MSSTDDVRDERDEGEGNERDEGGSIIIPGEGEEDLERVRKERDEYLAAAQRARADYVNLQRRMESQFADARRDALSRMALDVLAVLDDLERAIEHAGEGWDSDAVLHGLGLVRDKFFATLERYGIKRIEAMGESFDHNYHDAIAESPTDEVEPGIYALCHNRADRFEFRSTRSSGEWRVPWNPPGLAPVLPDQPANHVSEALTVGGPPADESSV